MLLLGLMHHEEIGLESLKSLGVLFSVFCRALIVTISVPELFSLCSLVGSSDFAGVFKENCVG